MVLLFSTKGGSAQTVPPALFCRKEALQECRESDAGKSLNYAFTELSKFTFDARRSIIAMIRGK